MRSLSISLICLALAFSIQGQTNGDKNQPVVDRPRVVNQPRLANQIGHKLAITSSAFSPNSKLVLTGSEDGTAILWDKTTGFPIRQFDPQWKHKNFQIGIGLVQFTQNGDYITLAIESNGDYAGIWNTATGKWVDLVGTLPPIYSLTDLAQTIGAPPGYAIAPTSDGAFLVSKKIERIIPRSKFAFSPDGRYLIGNVRDSLILWSLTTGEMIHQFDEISGKPVSFTFSPDSNFILAGTEDNKVYLLDTLSKKVVGLLAEYSDAVTSVAYSPDSKSVLVATRDKNAYLIDVKTNTKLQEFTVQSKEEKSEMFSSISSIIPQSMESDKAIVSFSPDGNLVITESIDDEQNFYRDPVYHRNIRIWQKSGRRIKWLEETDYKVLNIAFMQKKARILAYCSDGNVRIWDMVQNREVKLIPKVGTPKLRIETALKNQEVLEKRTEGIADPLRRFELSPDYRFFVATSYSGEARLWDVDSGNEISWLKKGNELLTSIDFSPDGKELMVGNSEGKGRLYDVSKTQEKTRFEGQFFNVNSVIISSDGRFILTGGGDQLAHLWDVATGKQIRRFEGHSGEVLSVALSADGNRVLTSGGDKKVFIWDAKSGQKIHSLKINGTVHSVLFSPDGNIAVTLSDEDIMLWNVESGKLLDAADFPTEEDNKERYLAATCAAFSPDGGRLFVAWEKGISVLAGVSKAGKLSIISSYVLKDAASVVLDTTHLTIADEPSFLSSVTFSSDGKYIFGGFTYGGQPILFDPSNGNVEQRFKTLSSGFRSAHFSPLDSNTVVGAIDGEVVLWNTKTGLELKRFSNTTSYVNNVSLSKDGKLAVTGHADGITRLWNTSTWEEICSLISFSNDDWVVTTPEGRFDTGNLETIRELRWLMPDMPYDLLGLEIYMRDYYEPRLLPRVLTKDNFNSIKPLVSVNRAQPIIKITKPEQHNEDPYLVSVTIEATEGEYKPRQGPARKSGIYDLRLFRDWQLVDYDPKSSANIAAYSRLGKQASFDDELEVWRSISHFKPDPLTANTRTFTIKLPRNRDLTEIELSAYAFNDDRVKSETYRQIYKLPHPLKASVKGKAYLITIGVGASEDRRWNLFFPINDARRLQKDLYDRLSQQYEQVVRIPLVSDYGGISKRFVDCIEKMPTREAIRTVLDLLAGREVGTRKELVPCAEQIQKASPEDLVLLSFSGHGYGDGKGNYYLFPHDTGKLAENQQITDKLPDELLNKLISSEELSAWMRDINAGEFVMILDACQSEAVTGKEFKPGPMGSRGLGQLAYDKGMRMIVATQADNQAVGSGLLRYGLLTAALLEGLESKVTVKEWLERAAERVPKLYDEKVSDEVKKRGKPQQPSVFDFSKMQR